MHQTTIAGRRLAQVAVSSALAIVLLHGKPASNCRWRHVLQETVAKGRVTAPDLIGQGDSDQRLPPRALSAIAWRRPTGF